MDGSRRLSVTDAEMSLRELDARIDERIGRRLDAFAEALKRQHDEQYQRLVELFKSGFPEGDPHEHRIAHEEMMRMVRARRRLFEEMTLHLMKGGVWALLIFLCVAAWQWVKAHVNGGG